MTFSWFRVITLTLSCALLSACSSPLRHAILAPSYSGTQFQHLPFAMQVQVNDHRISKFAIKVVDQEPQIYLPDANVPIQVQQAFNSAWQAQGITLSKDAHIALTLNIKMLNARITETYSQHQSIAKTEFEVVVRKGKKTFSKVYSGSAELNGPLRHEQAKIENQLNHLIEQTLTRIVSDSELANFLKE